MLGTVQHQNVVGMQHQSQCNFSQKFLQTLILMLAIAKLPESISPYQLLSSPFLPPKDDY
jgi:hypothetical protein